MLRVRFIIASIASAALLACAGAQIIDNGALDTGFSFSGPGGGDVGTQDTREFRIVVPNLVCVADGLTDPFTGETASAYRPEAVNLDYVTIREVITAVGEQIDEHLLVQAVSFEKTTPYWKCTAFVSGPGSDKNTNFYTGWQYANSTMLDWPVASLAFNKPEGAVCLGPRCLLFSPPHTAYTLRVVYVRRNPVSGRTGAPIIVSLIVEVDHATRERIACVVEYFSTVAAGATQKPKIHEFCKDALLEALTIPHNIEALIRFETVVALCAIDFSPLRDARDAGGKYDARWVTGYLIDSDEEPIACLLIEMASDALWNNGG